MTIKSLTTKTVIAFGLLAACLLQTATYSAAQEKEVAGSASSDDLKKLADLLQRGERAWTLRSAERAKAEHSGVQKSNSDNKLKLVLYYNRACRDSCPDPCSDTYQIIIDEPDVIRACPRE